MEFKHLFKISFNRNIQNKIFKNQYDDIEEVQCTILSFKNIGTNKVHEIDGNINSRNLLHTNFKKLSFLILSLMANEIPLIKKNKGI